jgi:hypothetical protein
LPRAPRGWHDDLDSRTRNNLGDPPRHQLARILDLDPRYLARQLGEGDQRLEHQSPASPRDQRGDRFLGLAGLQRSREVTRYGELTMTGHF